MSARRTQGRNVDAESGIGRVSTSRRGKKAAPPPPSSDEESEFVDSDLERELEMPAKDDSVRPRKEKKKKTRPPRVADHGVEGEEESGSELAELKAKETSRSVAPHMQLLLAATYHLSFASVVRPAVSNYIPSSYHLFSMALAMMDLVSENTYLQEMCPSFFSVGFYCYVGYLYFYQVLRAKDEVGMNQLTRAERRALRALKVIGEPESWPVPSPLIEFIRALGYYKSSNPIYSYVVPSLPDFSHVSRPAGNTTALGYANYDQVAGIQRVPPVSAFVEFIRLFGNRTASYDGSIGWIPTSNATLSATNTFMGIQDSTAANGTAFQALAFSDGWNTPTEGEMRWGPIQAGTKRQTIRRWNVPTLSNINIDGIETFLGVHDGVNSDWIRHLISQVNVMNRFFPGSTTLSAIDPICHIGTLTQIEAYKNPTRSARDNGWYRGRTGWNFEYRIYDDTEQGRILARVGIATGTNVHYHASVLPVGNRSHGRSGPFFEDDATNPNVERFERFLAEGDTESDPVQRFSEQLSTIYDSTGGKK